MFALEWYAGGWVSVLAEAIVAIDAVVLVEGAELDAGGWGCVDVVGKSMLSAVFGSLVG